MQIKKSELKDLIKSIFEECLEEDEISEMNVTANVQGYSTPHAFSKKNKSHKDREKKRAEVFDYKTTENEKSNTVKLNEGKSLYHIFRDHPDLLPEQKVGVAVREIRKLVSEIDKLLNVSSRYKSESKVHTSKMWKTTSKHLLKIDEKIKNISRKIKELR